MLEGDTSLVVTATKIRDKTYQRLLIQVPLEIATDSQFPFKPKQALKIQVDPTRTAIMLFDANNPKYPPSRGEGQTEHPQVNPSPAHTSEKTTGAMNPPPSQGESPPVPPSFDWASELSITPCSGSRGAAKHCVKALGHRGDTWFLKATAKATVSRATNP